VPGEGEGIIGEAGGKEEIRLEKRGEIRSIRVEADFSEGEKKNFPEGGDHGGGRWFGARIVSDFIWKGEGGEADSGARSSGVGPIRNRGDFRGTFDFDGQTKVGLGCGRGSGDGFNCSSSESEGPIGFGGWVEGEVSASTDGVVSTKIGAIIGAVADVSRGMEGAKDSGGGSIGIGEDVCRLGGIVFRFSYRQTKAWRGG
jgi:hypothetical protein